MLTADGPKVLEFNVRLGDPETQAVLPRLETDLVDVLEGAEPTWSEEATVNVVLAAEGYPTEPETGAKIKGLSNVSDDVLIFHAGTVQDGQKLLVNGGLCAQRGGSGLRCRLGTGRRLRSRGIHFMAGNAVSDRHCWLGGVVATDQSNIRCPPPGVSASPGEKLGAGPDDLSFGSLTGEFHQSPGVGLSHRR